MTISVYTEALFISSYILLLISCVSIMAVLLVLRRRQNFPFYYNPTLGLATETSYPQSTSPRAMKYIHPNIVAEPNTTTVTPSQEMAYHVNIIPKEWKLPVQNGTADQLIIHIEPDGSLTDEQRNIQRIIQHLKEMSEQPAI